MSDRIWDMFRAPEPPTLEQEITEALGLVQHWPKAKPATELATVCNDVLGTDVDHPCMLLHGHTGPHESRGGRWGAKDDFTEPYARCGAAIVSTMPCTLPATHTGMHSHDGIAHWGRGR